MIVLSFIVSWLVYYVIYWEEFVNINSDLSLLERSDLWLLQTNIFKNINRSVRLQLRGAGAGEVNEDLCSLPLKKKVAKNSINQSMILNTTPFGSYNKISSDFENLLF